MKHANKVKIDFHYTNAADSAKPGYLKNKFDRIRRELSVKAEAVKVEAQAKVRRLK